MNQENDMLILCNKKRASTINTLTGSITVTDSINEKSNTVDGFIESKLFQCDHLKNSQLWCFSPKSMTPNI